MATSDKSHPDYKSQVERVEQFCAGERLKNDIVEKVWTLTVDHVILPGDIRCFAGTSLRPVENPTIAINDHLHVCSPNGNDGAIKNKYLRQITQNLNGLSAETDRKWAVTDAQTSQEDEEKLEKMKKTGVQKCNFYRVVPATLRDGSNPLKNTNPVYKAINKFALTPGEIVLGIDASRQLFQENLAIQVIKHGGAKGWAYHRRLQLLEHPFGLMDKLPVATEYIPFPEDAPRDEVEPIYRATHGVVKGKTIEMITQLNDEEPAKRVSPLVYRISCDQKVKNIQADVDFEQNEYVLIETYRRGKPCTVRNFEGRRAEIGLGAMKDRTTDAWKLFLSNKDGNLGDFLLPDPGLKAEAAKEKAARIGAMKAAKAGDTAKRTKSTNDAAAAEEETETEETTTQNQTTTKKAPTQPTVYEKRRLGKSDREDEHERPPKKAYKRGKH